MSIIKNPFTHKDYPGIELYYTVDLISRRYNITVGDFSTNRKYKFGNTEDKLQRSTDVCHCLVLVHQEIAKILAQFPKPAEKKTEIDNKISSIFG